MSEYIIIDDYKASIHDEILNAIVRQDITAVELAEDRAIQEMEGYLSSRYDTVKIFLKRSAERNQLLVMFGIDIALYHLFSAHNPQKISQNRVDRYNRAIDWLNAVAKGDIIPEGLPTVNGENGEVDILNPVKWGSHQKYDSNW